MQSMNAQIQRLKMWRLAAIIAASTVFLPTSAAAYIGPGAGLSAIGVTVGFVLALVLLLAGLVWYPLKRVLKRAKKDTPDEAQEGQSS